VPPIARIGATGVKPSHKFAWVAVGYVLSLLGASAVVALRIAVTSGASRQAAGGMYGFGDTALFIGVFGVCALVPTGAALVFLRPNRTFWRVFSALGLAVALSGVAAAILYATHRRETTSPLAAWAGLSVLRILASPLMALAFLLCAVLSPHRGPRIAFLLAALVEVAVSAYGGAVWFVPLFLRGH
jgi:hypothetical protein